MLLYVRENQVSIRAFERANFQRLGEDVVKLQPALHYLSFKKLQAGVIRNRAS